MKKVLSLVLAVLMVLSLSVVAFAQTVEATGTKPEVDIESGKLDLGIGDNGGKDPEADPDKPGATYYYTLFDAKGNMITAKADVEHLKLTYSETGKMVEDCAIVKHNGVYKVKVTTKEFMTVAKEKTALTIVLKKNGIHTVLKTTINLTQAWQALADKHYVVDGAEVEITVPEICGINDGCKDGACKGDGCAVKPGYSYDNEYTDDHNMGLVVTLEDTVDYYEIYADETPVWFSGKNTHTVKGVMELTTASGAKELWTANEDAEIIYTVSFDGDFAFDYASTQHVSVDKDMFVYAVEGGKYDLGKFTWNEATSCWETKTMAPIDVLVSDVELKGLNAASAGKENPGTGSVDFVNVAVALGVVSLAAAGAVALKK